MTSFLSRCATSRGALGRLHQRLVDCQCSINPRDMSFSNERNPAKEVRVEGMEKNSIDSNNYVSRGRRDRRLHPQLRDFPQSLFDGFPIPQPFRDLLSRELDGYFPKSQLEEKSGFRPRTDVFETNQETVIQSELPGLTKADVKLEIKDDFLRLTGERHSSHLDEGADIHRIERHYGKFVREFSLPSKSDVSKIKATFKDGVLDIRIPKTEVSENQTIEIN